MDTMSLTELNEAKKEAFRILTGQSGENNIIDAAGTFTRSALNIYARLQAPGSTLSLIENHKSIIRETKAILDDADGNSAIIEKLNPLLPVIREYQQELGIAL